MLLKLTIHLWNKTNSVVIFEQESYSYIIMCAVRPSFCLSVHNRVRLITLWLWDTLVVVGADNPAWLRRAMTLRTLTSFLLKPTPLGEFVASWRFWFLVSLILINTLNYLRSTCDPIWYANVLSSEIIVTFHRLDGNFLQFHRHHMYTHIFLRQSFTILFLAFEYLRQNCFLQQ